MGMMIDGKWSTEWYRPDEKGRFVRPKTSFRSAVTADGSSGFPAEAGRYHLYVSYACPWASRTLMVRKLKKLDDTISVSSVSPLMGKNGWELPTGDGAGPVEGARYLYEVYARARPDYTGRADAVARAGAAGGSLTTVTSACRAVARGRFGRWRVAACGRDLTGPGAGRRAIRRVAPNPSPTFGTVLGRARSRQLRPARVVLDVAAAAVPVARAAATGTSRKGS